MPLLDKVKNDSERSNDHGPEMDTTTSQSATQSQRTTGILPKLTLEKGSSLKLPKLMRLLSTAGEGFCVEIQSGVNMPEIYLYEGSDNTGRMIARTRTELDKAVDFCISPISEKDIVWSEMIMSKDFEECSFDVPGSSDPRNFTWSGLATGKANDGWMLRDTGTEADVCRFQFAGRSSTFSKEQGTIEWQSAVSREEELAILITLLGLLERRRSRQHKVDGVSAGFGSLMMSGTFA
ncbi:hypothetical protein BDZ85DRAFT_261288 [Elsinoe ampelina]|uniref:Uncharacterized protein n=1 Tax=Elsinoe ampelina TaxID=302913 RepID=A0A6A6GG36_9PEZI|nr:hypothetical protein BDZ85DRAFT_261288 [Elsinoe ampelina]